MARAKTADAQWWNATKSGRSPHEVLVPLVEKLFEAQQNRYIGYRRLAEVYGADMTARGGSTDPFETAFSEELTMNELANTVETLHSQLYKNRIVVSVDTVGGDYGQWSRAKKLNRWIDGVLNDCDLHGSVVPRVGLHAIIAGTGFYKVGHRVVDAEKGIAEITIETSDPLDMAVDPLDAEGGNPMCIFEIGVADRTALEDIMREKDDTLYGTPEERLLAIENAKTAQDDQLGPKDVGILDLDTIRVYHGWRRAPNKKTPGRYIMCTSAGTLIDREYKLGEFPHIPQRWMMAPSGYYGQSAVARLAPGQRTYDKMTMRGDKCHDLMGIPRIILRKGSGFEKRHIDDVEASILEADDPSGIKEWNPTPIHPDFYRERDSIPGKMRGLVGVSQFSSTGQLPTQLREASGVALESFVDQESARHAMAHREYERAIVKLVYRIFDEALWLQEHGFTVIARSPNRNHLEEIDFKDVSMDREEFKLRVLPISHLSRTFTGKVNQLAPLLNNGAIKLPTYRRLLEVPDIEQENDMETATDELVDAMLNKVYETGLPFDLLAFDDEQRIFERGSKFINYLRLRDVPSEKLLPVVEYVTEAYNRILKKEAEAAAQQAAAQAPPAQGGAGAPDMGGAMPPPVPGGPEGAV